jgi:quercetin dioxygenase-like cupin family protein
MISKPIARGRRTLMTPAMLFMMVGVALAALAASGERMILVPSNDAKFVPVDPSDPASTRIAVLRGDPATGPSAMLMQFGKGAGRLHIHSSDYQLVVLEGTMKHWVAGQAEADTPPLERGSYWYQPGNEAHADSCLSESCLMFISWAGKRDTRRVESPGAGIKDN